MPADGPVGCPDAAGGRELPDLGPADRAGADRRAGVDQGRGVGRQRASSGVLPEDVAIAIHDAAVEVADGPVGRPVPVDVFQTGSGTSTNMNMNEVHRQPGDRAARPAGAPERRGERVAVVQRRVPVGHPPRGGARDHGASCCPRSTTSPASLREQAERQRRGGEGGPHPPDGRHAGDARPGARRLRRPGRRRRPTGCAPRCRGSGELPLGGTAVGTGINAPAGFGAARRRAARRRHGPAAVGGARPLRRPGRARRAGRAVGRPAGARGRARQDRQRPPLDGRRAHAPGWPRSACPTCSPAASIMPGKVNPVIPEAVTQVCAQVIGNDAAVAFAGSQGNFELNVYLPVIARNLLESIRLLASVSPALRRPLRRRHRGRRRAVPHLRRGHPAGGHRAQPAPRLRAGRRAGEGVGRRPARASAPSWSSRASSPRTRSTQVLDLLRLTRAALERSAGGGGTGVGRGVAVGRDERGGPAVVLGEGRRRPGATPPGPSPRRPPRPCGRRGPARTPAAR